MTVVFNRPSIFIAASLGVAAAFLLVGGSALFEMRQDAMERSAESAQNLAMMLEHDIARNLEIYEASMEAVRTGLADAEVMELQPRIRQLVLFDRAADAAYLGSLLVADANGNLVLDSRAIPPRPLNVAHRDYFRIHKRDRDLEVYVSAPYQPQLSDVGETIAISKKLVNREGHFAGIVAGTLRTAYFRKLTGGMNIGPKGTLSVLRPDGVVIFRRSYGGAKIGAPIRDDRAVANIGHMENGTFIHNDSFDGVERLHTFRRLQGYPLVVSVALATEDIYQNWRHRAISFGILIGTLSAAIVAISIMFARQIRLRLAVENRLERLSHTDELTGLGNRRHLDRCASLEWKQCRKRGEPLSLLMIDVDHFKQYNDYYGHGAGDGVLQRVAASLAARFGRGSYHVARYGGEEFTVLLPNISLHDAVCIAEEIRSDIFGLAMHHERSPLSVVTVSIGVATAHPSSNHLSEVNTLFCEADEALYRAKHADRNRVMSVAASKP